MKINKIIAVPAAALVLTSVCTSCGKKDNKDPSSKSSVKESSSEVTSATEEKTTGSDSADINDYIDEETPQPALWKVTGFGQRTLHDGNYSHHKRGHLPAPRLHHGRLQQL